MLLLLLRVASLSKRKIGKCVNELLSLLIKNSQVQHLAATRLNAVPAMRRNGLIRTREFTLRRCADFHTCTFDIIPPISAGVELRPRTAEGASGEGTRFSRFLFLLFFRQRRIFPPKERPRTEGTAFRQRQTLTTEALRPKESIAEGEVYRRGHVHRQKSFFNTSFVRLPL